MDTGRATGLSLAARNEEFLDGVYRQNWSDLCLYLKRKFGAGPPEPEDLAQAAFARFAALDNQREIPNPRAYLMLTARNLAIDALRRRTTDEKGVRSLGIFEENVRESDAENVLSSREELVRLAEIVATLKPKERAAFLMHRIDGLSYVEISDRLNISQSGARLLVDRALAICIRKMRP